MLTPAMKQYYDIKEKYKDSILFFRMWDFYEMFWDDAKIAHKVLWIAITSRNKNASDPIELAWVPFHAKDKYLPQLVNAWYKVAIVEQISDPKLKWIVKREVVRVVTPATLSLESDKFEDSNSNIILSISFINWLYWISFINIWENKWNTWEFNNLDDFSREIYKISPKEVIIEKNLFNNIEIKELLSKKYSLNIYYFSNSWDSRKKLINHFWVKNLEWFWIEWKIACQESSAQLLNYLEQNQKSGLTFLDSITYMTFSWYLDLDESTIRNLDLIYNISTKSSIIWTLYWVLNKTKTSMWNRFLKESIIYPLQDIDEIKKRQNFIEQLLNDKITLDKIREKLWLISDIDSILNRIALNRALPRDLLNLKRSLESILEVYKIIKSSWNKKLENILSLK